MMQFVKLDTEQGRRFVFEFAERPCLHSSDVCKKEGDLYGKCESQMILGYLTFVVV